MIASFARLTFMFFDKVSPCSVTGVIQRTHLDNPHFDDLAEDIAKIRSIAGVLLFKALFIRSVYQ